jgi:16S rRNA (guanine966-N2)-methyltransferase
MGEYNIPMEDSDRLRMEQQMRRWLAPAATATALCWLLLLLPASLQVVNSLNPSLTSHSLGATPYTIRRKRNVAAAVFRGGSREHDDEDHGRDQNKKTLKFHKQGVKRPLLKRPHSPNNLRIVGGAFKGRKLESPKVYLRPMMSKVRMALYNSITSILEITDLSNKRVLDVYSGSGCVGLEALSRGAAHVTFVDLSSECSRTCEYNARLCGYKANDPSVNFVTVDAEAFLRQPSKYVDDRGVQTFDIIVLSPPYKEISFPSLINTVCESPCLGINSLVALEYPKELGVMPSSLVSNKTGRTLYGLRNRSYGRTLLALFVHLPDREYTTKEDDFLDCGNLVTYSPPVS